MSAPEPITPRCNVCDKPSVGENPEGYHLCARHLKETRRWQFLEAELLGVVSKWAEKHNLSPQQLYETVGAIQQPTSEAASDEQKNAPDFIAKRSHAPRNSYEGGFRRPFDVVPEHTLEQVIRDVTLTFANVPLWAVEALFQRVHKDMGRPNVGKVSAQLVVEYEDLRETEYEQLYALRDAYGWTGELDIVTDRTRLYAPRHMAEQRMREVEKERSENPRE